ncbi:MAG: ArnT family glycosyltransferase [Saprospiraceae bacterium]
MPIKNQWLYIFLLLLAINLFLFNGQITLWDEDEAAYAGFASTMLESGNWVQPDFLWSRIHRKTPLHFWNVALSYKLFGVNEWATRLSSVLSLLLTCFLTWRWGRSVFGESVSRWAAIVLATTLIVPLTGKVALTDATLLLFQTSAVLSLFNFLKTPHWKWNLTFWLSMSLGVLTKGPLIIILCGGLWLFLLAFHPSRKTLVRLHPWFFGILALLPTALWMNCSWQQDNGELVTFLYDWYIAQRVGGSVLGQTGIPGYHLVILIIAFLPWLAFFVPAMIHQFRNFFSKENNHLLLSGWLIFGWLFFELMSSKLPSYALGAHPAVAFLIGYQVVKFFEGTERAVTPVMTASWIFSLFIMLVLAIGLPIGIHQFFKSELLPAYFIFSAVVILLLGIQIYCFRKKRYSAFVYSLAGTGWGILFLIISCLVPIVEESPMKSLSQVASIANQKAIEQNVNHDDIVVIFSDLGNKMTKVSLPFYISRYFKRYGTRPKDKALQAYLKKDPFILIVNEEVLEYLGEELNQKGRSLEGVQRIAWWSTDDKLRSHDYYVLSNF